MRLHILTEGKHWPADYIKTGINMVKASQLGQQSWYSDQAIQQDMQTFANDFESLSHKNSNLGFFSTIIKWFIEYSTSAQKYQEFIEQKLDGIIGALQVILNDPAYAKDLNDIKTKWSFKQFEELQQKIADEAKASSDEKMKNIVKRDDYEIIPINSYEELNEQFSGPITGYKGESKWCHTNGKSTYDSWTKNGTQMFFVLAKKGWKDIQPPDPKTTNAFDEYGTSLIAILVDVATGKLLYETLRWNHVIDPAEQNHGSSVDHAFKDNWGDLCQAVGMDVKAEVGRLISDKQDELKKVSADANAEVAKILKNAKIITDVTIPKKLKQHVTEINIPDNIESIGNSAFYNCSSLIHVTIPDSVTSIEDHAFFDCTNLKSVTIPGSVTSIGSFAFSGCSGLKAVTIGNGVTNIGSSAFSGCSGLTSVTIPGRVTSIGVGAFYNCNNLATVYVKGSIDKIKSLYDWPENIKFKQADELHESKHYKQVYWWAHMLDDAFGGNSHSFEIIDNVS